MPSGHLRSYIEHYFAPHPSQQVRELFASRAILDFATGSVMLFEPIYLYSIGWPVHRILLFYAVLYLLYVVALPLGGRICRRHGNERSILFSSPFLIIWYLSFFAIPFHPAFIIAALIAIVIQKILYWPGYHANFAAWTEAFEGGREVSNMAAIVGLVTVLAPAFGGLVIAYLGYGALFLLVSLLILASNVPLLRTKEVFEPKDFSYGDAVRRLVGKRHRRRVVALLGFGEELIALVAWPVFIATIIGDPTSIGAVVSLAMIANVLATLYVGRVSDEGRKTTVLRSGVIYTAASWLLRPLVTGGLGIFLMDSFYRVAKNMVNVPLLALVYDSARRGQVMEGIVLFEMALAVGKAVAALAAAAILWRWPDAWPHVFVLATAFTAMFALVTEDREPRSA